MVNYLSVRGGDLLNYLWLDLRSEADDDVKLRQRLCLVLGRAPQSA